MGVYFCHQTKMARMILFLVSTVCFCALVANQSVTDFVLLSSGPASAYQGSTLGVYSPMPEDADIYQQKGGDYYMFKDKGKWQISSRITKCNKTTTLGCVFIYSASIKTEDIQGVGEVWSYGKDKEWVNDDTTLQFVPISSPLAACILCSEIILTGHAKKHKPENLGVFSVIPGKFSAGRPVYQNKAGRYLMVKNEVTSFGVWDDVDKRLRAGKGDEGERFLRSGSAPTCVTDLEGVVGRGEHGWQIRHTEVSSEEWVADDTVRAACLDTAAE